MDPIFAGKCFTLGISTIFFSFSFTYEGRIQRSCPVWQLIPNGNCRPCSGANFISIRLLSQAGIRFCTEGVMWAPSRQRVRPSEERRCSFRHNVVLLSRYGAPPANRGAFLAGKGAFSTMAAPSS